jgi:amino acid permease
MIKSTIKTITSVLFTWLLYLIGMLPIINCIVVVYWLFNQRDREISFERHYRLTCAIYISAFFTFGGILYIGVQTWLFIIPRSWGSYGDDGEWVTTRSSIAGMLAFAGSFLVAYLFEKYGGLTDKIKQLEEEKYKKEDEYKELQEKLEVLLEEEDYDEVENDD